MNFAPDVTFVGESSLYRRVGVRDGVAGSRVLRLPPSLKLSSRRENPPPPILRTHFLKSYYCFVDEYDVLQLFAQQSDVFFCSWFP